MTIYQNIERSKQLSDEVEAFLRSGGSVSSLERGYTAYPTGVLPPAKKAHTEAKRAEKEKAEKLKVTSKVQQRVSKEQQLEEQKTVLAGFFERACSKDVRNLVEISGVSTKNLRIARSGKSVMYRERWLKLKQHIENFVFLPPPEPKQPKPKQEKPKPVKNEHGEEFKRRKLIHQLRAKAEAEGKNTFIAECSKHGWTTYKIYNGASRCYECRLKSNNATLDPESDQVKMNRNQRADYNREQMKLAMEKGTKDFIGLCKNCGYSSFRAHKVSKRNKYEYRCMPCQNASHAKHNRKRNEKA